MSDENTYGRYVMLYSVDCTCVTFTKDVVDSHPTWQYHLHNKLTDLTLRLPYVESVRVNFIVVSYLNPVRMYNDEIATDSEIYSTFLTEKGNLDFQSAGLLF